MNSPIPSPTGEVAIQPRNQLLEVADAQKMLLWSIAAILPCFLFPFIGIGVWFFQVYATYRMGKSLSVANTQLWVLGTMIPLIGLLILLIMNSKATAVLRDAGIPVGLMGAKMNAIQNIE